MVKMEPTVRGDERLAARMAEPLLRALYLGEHSLLRALTRKPFVWGALAIPARTCVTQLGGPQIFTQKIKIKSTNKSILQHPSHCMLGSETHSHSSMRSDTKDPAHSCSRIKRNCSELFFWGCKYVMKVRIWFSTPRNSKKTDRQKVCARSNSYCKVWDLSFDLLFHFYSLIFPTILSYDN